MKKILSIFLGLTLGMALLGMVAPRVAVAADGFGLEDTAGETPFKGSTKTLPQIAGTVISAGLSLVGVIFLALAVYGGFRWMVARGDTKATKEARDTIVDATIGIILIVSAYAITNFLFSSVILQLK